MVQVSDAVEQYLAKNNFTEIDRILNEAEAKSEAARQDRITQMPWYKRLLRRFYHKFLRFLEP